MTGVLSKREIWTQGPGGIEGDHVGGFGVGGRQSAVHLYKPRREAGDSSFLHGPMKEPTLPLS